ncbi:hypothetical protein GGU11DRAFT_157447 [Lentinula aff. detonsa]|nr:hypothetical protein GGU11DRAFT_157447 [Lentinula aff. detonsa]
MSSSFLWSFGSIWVGPGLAIYYGEEARSQAPAKTHTIIYSHSFIHTNIFDSRRVSHLVLFRDKSGKAWLI